MREGRYFRIPENPVDMTDLWVEGKRVAVEERPTWMAPEDVDGYRSIGWAAWPSLRTQEYARYRDELDLLRSSSLIVDEDPHGSGEYHIYQRSPTGPWYSDAVYSIGVYMGDCPLSLGAAENIWCPVLSHESVTDIPAAFVADPFMIKVGILWHMFFEVMNARTGLGVIGHAVSEDAVSWRYQKIVLAEPFHLSYPSIFEWGGEYYMVPETHQARAVRLYKAVEFPSRWAFVGNLLERPYLADPTLFRHLGKWWMFADASPRMDNSVLRLYFADELQGRWHEHPRSPIVKNNPYIARPAGRVVHYQNHLLRYAQSCLPYYGTNVLAFEITELTTEKYREKEAPLRNPIGPTSSDWNACGMHHIDAHRMPYGWWVACVDGWTSATILRHLAQTAQVPPA